eukprot:2536618-Pyramimonas_sp.AAC.1
MALMEHPRQVLQLVIDGRDVASTGVEFTYQNMSSKLMELASSLTSFTAPCPDLLLSLEM